MFLPISGRITNRDSGHAVDGKVATGELTLREAWNQDYDVNVSGAHVMTHVFAPLLLASADAPRLLFLTSGLSSLQQTAQAIFPGVVTGSQAPGGGIFASKGWPKPPQLFGSAGYRASKAGLNLLMLNWHWALHADGVKTFSVSPGFLATTLGGDPEALKARGAGDPARGGELIRDIVEGRRDADVGKVVNSSGLQPF